MSETANIAALALSAAEKIFSAFGWAIHPITDEVFPCGKIEKHQTKGSGGKHPVDCVFSYPDPFSNRRVFLNCDLKSYAKSTLKTTDFSSYIRSLAKAIDCARSSKDWQDRYIETSVGNWVIDGLLFVYNHDQNYDKDFKASAKGLAPASLQHPSSARIHLLGPEDLSYLQSIIADFKTICAEQELPYSKRRFFYAQQVLLPPGESLIPVATIEMLRGNLIIFEASTNNEPLFIAYLKGEGTLQDFEYLITYLYRKGVMSLGGQVHIKGAEFVADAQVNFDNARRQFLKRHYEMKEISQSLERISFGRVDRITSSFSSVDESLQRNK